MSMLFFYLDIERKDDYQLYETIVIKQYLCFVNHLLMKGCYWIHLHIHQCLALIRTIVSGLVMATDFDKRIGKNT